jgi:hypothetical protein
MSQNKPNLGGSLNLSILFISSSCYFFFFVMYYFFFKEKYTVFSSGDIPPCNAKNLLFKIHARGRLSKESIKISYIS